MKLYYKVLEIIGMLGNIFAMLLMPCCFPFVLLILSGLGITGLQKLWPRTPYITIVSLLLVLIGLYNHAKLQHSYGRFLFGILWSTMILLHFFVCYDQTWLYYIGLVGIFCTSFYDLGKKVCWNSSCSSYHK